MNNVQNSIDDLDLNLILESDGAADPTSSYTEYIESSTQVGGGLGASGSSVASTANLESYGQEILKSIPSSNMEDRKRTALETKWLKTILDKEPLKDADGNYIDEDKISKKAIGYRMLIDGVEKIMTKEMLQAFVAERAFDTLGDPSTGEPCLGLTSRTSKVKEGAKPKLPVFSFKAVGSKHTLTKHHEQWDCVEFAREPEIENGDYKRKPVPAQAKAGKKDDPTFVEKTYIVYKWKEGYEVFAKNKGESTTKNQSSFKAFQLLLAVKANANNSAVK